MHKKDIPKDIFDNEITSLDISSLQQLSQKYSKYKINNSNLKKKNKSFY